MLSAHFRGRISVNSFKDQASTILEAQPISSTKHRQPSSSGKARCSTGLIEFQCAASRYELSTSGNLGLIVSVILNNKDQVVLEVICKEDHRVHMHQ